MSIMSVASRPECQRFAVILDHATPLTHRCFFRRPTALCSDIGTRRFPGAWVLLQKVYTEDNNPPSSVSPQRASLSYQPHCNPLYAEDNGLPQACTPRSRPFGSISLQSAAAQEAT